MIVLSHFICVWLFVTLWTLAHQAPLSMGFFRRDHWSRLPCPPPGEFPDSGIKLESEMSPALAGRFFTTNATWEAQVWLGTEFYHQIIEDLENQGCNMRPYSILSGKPLKITEEERGPTEIWPVLKTLGLIVCTSLERQETGEWIWRLLHSSGEQLKPEAQGPLPGLPLSRDRDKPLGTTDWPGDLFLVQSSLGSWCFVWPRFS